MRLSAAVCRSVVFVAIAVLAVWVLPAGAADQGAGDGGGRGWSAGLEGAERGERELVSRRTATTRTFVDERGRLLTKAFAAPVNFRDGQGGWEAIDPTLEPDGAGGYVPTSAPFELSLPGQVGGDVGPSGGAGVRVAAGGDAVAFALKGAAVADAEVDGRTARYRSVFPGTDLEYTALTSGVKESLILHAPGAADDFVFDLDPGGLHPEATGSGLVTFETVGGQRSEISVAPAFMRDAAGARSDAVEQTVRETSGGWELVLSPDRDWLNDPGREFPVEVDPTTTVGASQNCYIVSTDPNGDYCPASFLVVGQGAAGRINRSLLKFDLTGIDKRALVLTADLTLRNNSGAAKAVDAHRVTQAWTANTTWNKYDGTTAWAAAGGDYDPTVADQNPSVGGGAGWEGWDLTELSQQWINGAQPNHGVLLKAANEAAAGDLGFSSSSGSYPPYLEVWWKEREGTQRQFSMHSEQLSDRMSGAVNLANGNLAFTANDINISGTGLDLAVSRTLNSLGEEGPEPMGYGWALSAVAALHETSNGDQVFVGPSGDQHLYRLKPGGGYTTPTAIDATLKDVGGGAHELSFDKALEVYAFDANGNLTSHKDRNANTITFDGTTPGHIVEMTDTQGRELDFDYNKDNLIESIKDPTGRTWSYTYTAGGNLETYTDPENNTTEYAYSADEFAVKDPNGTWTRFAIDGDYRVTAIERDHNPSTGSYDTKTSFAYSSPTSPCNPATDIAKTVVTNPRGKQSTYCFDRELRATKVTDPLGHTQESTYTTNSDAATMTAPGSATTKLGYDKGSLNNLEQIEMPAGEKATSKYEDPNFDRLITQSTDPQGIGALFSYDTVGNLGTVADGGSPTQVQATLEYNGTATDDCTDDPTTHAGTVRCAIDGNDNKTLYGYDDDGNLTSITPPMPMGATTITNDALSRVATVKDGKAHTKTFSYDKLDRVTQISYSNGDTIKYSYDDNGNLIKRVDSVHGTTEWDYDDLNRRTGDDLPSGDNTYTYDDASNLVALADSGGGTTKYGYDDSNRLTSLAEAGGSCTSTISLCTTFGYNDRDQRTSTAYPNGVTQSVTYDLSDKPTQIKAAKGGTTLTQFDYTYGLSPTGESNLVQTVTDKNANKTTYDYETVLGRLKSAVEKNSGGTTIDSRAYDYDPASNLKSQVINGTTTSYGYNAANELCWEYTGTSSNACGTPPSGATTYTHDANGNTTASSAGLALSYTIKDQTTSFTPPGGSATSFGYAGPGQQERTATAGTTQHNSSLGLLREGTTNWTREPGGALISQNTSGTRHYYLADRLGSVAGLADNSGTLAQTYKYDPYGRITATTGSTTNPFRYTGAYQTGGTNGLYKMGARYYSPLTARWTQQDPIDRPSDLREGNRYSYAAGDPVNGVDPSGCGVEQVVRCVGFICGWDSLRACGYLRQFTGLWLGCAAVRCGGSVWWCAKTFRNRKHFP